ncbi:MAG: T9SS type A sorting domain-containing protein [Candidatus Delongbacteria bacterium]|nr:T9SS type A sorting domain-containing protein [Candidatus Delongbacteria bacterium]
MTIIAAAPIEIKGNWINLGDFVSGNGKVTFTGSSTQSIQTNSNSFYDIEFDNTNDGDYDISLVDNLTVSHSAKFINGIVKTGSNKFTFTSAATTNSGEVTSFVDGIVEKIDCSSTLGFTFPTGDVNTRDIGAGMQTYKIWAPFTATPVGSGTIDVTYFYSNEDLHTWWYHDWTHEYPLTHTTDREYWLVNSSQDLDVTLYWRDNDPCSIHDFCNGGSQLQHLTTAYWDNIWKDVGGDASAETTINGDISSFVSVPFSAKGERQITFAGTNKDIPLPVELLNFEAACNHDNQKIELKWTTASETNNDYYTLYRSKNSLNFKEIARIDGYGTVSNSQTYAYTDNFPPSGDVYYKLSQTDLDGATKDLNIISINCFSDNQQYDVQIYPNPVTEELNIHFGNWPTQTSSITIHDMSGRVIIQKKLDKIDKEPHFTLPMHDISPGMYMLWLQSDSMNKNIKIEKH